MSAPFLRRHDCRLCGSTDLKEILSFGETPLANAYRSPDDTSPEVFAPLVVNFCNSCKLVQLRDVVDPEVLFKNYLYVSGTSPSFVAHFRDYAKTVAERFALGKDSLVVDVGSNDGVLLSHFKELGMRILGIDPAENIAEEATKQGIPTIAKFFTPQTAGEIATEHGKAHIITANNVFAHTDDVAGFVEAVKVLLRNDGVFIFEVQYLKDLVEKNLFDIVYHEHLCYYHITPLVPLFERLGLRIFDVERVPTHGGSIRVFVGWAKGPHAIVPRLGELLSQETALNDSAPYEAFAKRVAENRTKLLAMLTNIKKEGRRIVGYGAPAKATTFCYALGIDASTLDYIVDDAPMKQGLLMPGTHIPIKAPSVLYEDKPDYCLILAWNFAEPIMKNHVRFIDGGGKFITPMPEPRIV
ncbi:MAG: class I SAM-dependent methyltransferase [bacterium]|nr:class I SAM-dependent methyltransferase [bacterium]